MAYDATFHRSSRVLTETGDPFAYSDENLARFNRVVTRYPPDRRRSAVLPALYLVQEQQGYITAAAISSAEPFRRIGVCLAIRRMKPAAAFSPRSIIPGATAFTEISGARAFAITFVNMCRAAFDEQ